MTFNIRYDTPNDGEDQWELRKGEVVDLVSKYAPDVFGLQEAVLNQVDYVDSLMTNYTYVGVGRDDGNIKGEFSPLFYDSTKLELMDQNTFWLSPTPEEVSKGWDAALPRVCTYGLFKEKSSQKLIWVYNTHFDHIGTTARISSAATIVQRMYKDNISKSPVVLMGDLNAVPTDGPIVLLRNHFTDTMDGVEEGTFWGFDPEAKADRRIDYIFVKDAPFKEAKIISDLRTNGRHVSDHLPVMVTVYFED